MPTARNRQKHQSKSLIAGGLPKRTLAVGVVIIGALLVLVSAALFFIGGGAGVGQSKHFTKYLNDKYGQEFVVENIRTTGAGIGSRGSWRGDAYPKSNPSLRFEIRMPQGTDKVDYETFLQVLWSRQGEGEVKKFLEKELPDSEGYLLTIQPGKKLYDSIQGQTPNLDSVLASNSGLVAYSLSVRNRTNLSPNEPSDTELENALKVVNFVKSKKTLPASYAYYNYRDKSFNKKDKDGKQKYQYGIHLEREELDDINSAIDLKKFFVVLGQ